MINVLNVKQILNNSNFINTYKNFILKRFDYLTDDDYSKILAFALLMFKSKNIELIKFGYNLIVSYSIYKDDLIPLYEISLYNWNTPILKLIQKSNCKYKRNNFFEEIENISAEYLKSENKDIYYTKEQLEMQEDFINIDSDTAIIAPTSFGKTELLKDYVNNNYLKRNICIIVPTKVLINQLRGDFQNFFKNHQVQPKIVTHYDTKFDETKSNIFILTQERLFKLVFDKKTRVVFDTLLIDEAHNIFEKNERAILLAKTIILLKSINNNLQIKYFSPIIENFNSLYAKYVDNNLIKEIKVQPLIKVNRFYIADFKEKKHQVYDEMTNDFFDLEEHLIEDKFNFIFDKSMSKNLLYFNSPNSIRKEIHEFVSKLNIIDDPILDDIINSLKDYVHKDYDLIDCIKHGVVYHYGVMPDNVRMFIEACTKEHKFIKFVFCTSTLLEGVNMPFDKMFICEIKKGKANISYHQLKNLIGRVNRYSTIFDNSNGSLKNLISEIYFIKDKNSKSNYDNFIKERLSLYLSDETKKDKITNPLLESSNTNIPEKEMQYLSSLVDNINIENKEKYIIKTEIGKAMLESNVIEFDIKKYEYAIEDKIKKCNIDDDLLDKICSIFIEDIELESDNKFAIYRLKQEKAKNYYRMFFQWRMKNASLTEKISRTIHYWKNYGDKKNIFVGERWGNKKRNFTDIKKLYIDITNMPDKEIVNYAILRLKEEDEYIDYSLMKFIELLYKFKKVSDKEYNLIQYGTDNIVQIFFLKDGLSSELSQLLSTKYISYVIKVGELYKLKENILQNFDDNKILLNELKYYVK